MSMNNNIRLWKLDRIKEDVLRRKTYLKSWRLLLKTIGLRIFYFIMEKDIVFENILFIERDTGEIYTWGGEELEILKNKIGRVEIICF